MNFAIEPPSSTGHGVRPSYHKYSNNASLCWYAADFWELIEEILITISPEANQIILLWLLFGIIMTRAFADSQKQCIGRRNHLAFYIMSELAMGGVFFVDVRDDFRGALIAMVSLQVLFRALGSAFYAYGGEEGCRGDCQFHLQCCDNHSSFFAFIFWVGYQIWLLVIPSLFLGLDGSNWEGMVDDSYFRSTWFAVLVVVTFWFNGTTANDLASVCGEYFESEYNTRAQAISRKKSNEPSTQLQGGDDEGPAVPRAISDILSVHTEAKNVVDYWWFRATVAGSLLLIFVILPFAAFVLACLDSSTFASKPSYDQGVLVFTIVGWCLYFLFILTVGCRRLLATYSELADRVVLV